MLQIKNLPLVHSGIAYGTEIGLSTRNTRIKFMLQKWNIELVAVD